MIIYLLKSTFCLVLLLGFYHLVLEKEKMHRFNRFYLLGSIIFSFIVPSFSITVAPTTIESPIFTEVNTFQQVPFEVLQQESIAETIDYTHYVFGIYILISAILLLFLSRKVYGLLNKVKQNQHINYFSATVVLLKERIVPYTFLHYIFINKHTYQTDSVEEQILTHELAHVEQKHSIDVLFIEVLQNLFWFNPIFRYYKKSIQLNHEFLADDAVINSHKNITEYQQVLLNTTAQNNNIYLASNLNYSLTKKRLLMMTTPSSKTKILLKKLLVAPLVAGFIFAFAQRVEAQEKNDKPQVVEVKKQENGISEVEMNEYRELISKAKNARMFRYKQLTRMKSLYKKMSIKQQNSVEDVFKLAPDLPPFSRNKKTPTKTQFNSWKNKEKFALWIDGKVVDNSVLNKYKNTDFPYFSGSFVHKNARKGKFPQEYQFHLYTHASFKKMKEREAKEKKNTITIFINRKGGLLVNGKVTTIDKLKSVLDKIDIDENNAFVTINGDQSVKKGIVTDIREILRESELYKISYNSKLFPPPPPKSQVIEIKKLQNENELLIFIKKDGKLIIKNQIVAYSNLKKVLNKEIKNIDKARVILKTDPKAPLTFTHLNKIKNALRKNGIYAIRFQNFTYSPKEEIIIRKELSKKERAQVIEVVEQQKTRFHKNWFITIDGQKYYYTFDKRERVARYYKNGKLVKLDIPKEYRKKHKMFERLKSTGKHYVFKSKKEQKVIDQEFSDLGGMYFRMPRADKNRVPFPNNPRHPYVTLIKNGKKFYKKKSELTKEDRLLMMPPPPRPNASKEDLKKFKASMKAWKKRTGQKPQVREINPVKIEVIKNKKGLVEVIETPDWKTAKKRLQEVVEVKEVEEVTEVKELVEVGELKEVEEVIEIREAHDLPEVVELVEARELKEVVLVEETNEELEQYKKKHGIKSLPPRPTLKKNATKKERRRYEKAIKKWRIEIRKDFDKWVKEKVKKN